MDDRKGTRRRWVLRALTPATLACLLFLSDPQASLAADASTSYYKAINDAWDVMSDANRATNEACGPQAFPPRLAACLAAVKAEERAAPTAVALVRGVKLDATASAGALARDAALRSSLTGLSASITRLRVALERRDRKAYPTANDARQRAVLDFVIPAGEISTRAPAPASARSGNDAALIAFMVVGGIAVLFLMTAAAFAVRSDKDMSAVLPSAADDVMTSSDALNRMAEGHFEKPADPMERLALAVELAVTRYDRSLRKGLMQHPLFVASVGGVVATVLGAVLTAVLKEGG